MKIIKQNISGGKQQFADKIINNDSPKKKTAPLISESSMQESFQKGDIPTCINQLKSIIKNPSKQKELLLLESNFNRNEKEYLDNLISYDNYQLTHSKTIASISRLISEAEKLET